MRVTRTAKAMFDRLGLLVVVVLAVGISAIWLVRVPFMQETDEQAHADYVFALYNGGGWFHAAHSQPEDYVTPQVQYLAARSRFWQLRTFPRARAARDYGSANYFRQLDAGAPRPSAPSLRSRNIIPYVAQNYPVGYYVVASQVMRFADVLSGGSLTAKYFAARSLGIIFLAVNLLLSYAILRRLRLPTTIALLLVFALGLFPLASWVSAYIQPDTLVWSCTTGVLYSALEWRVRPFDTRQSVLLIAILAITFFVKTHYAIVLCAVCGLMICGYLLRNTPRLSIRLCTLLALLLASAAAYIAAGSTTPVGHLVSQDASVLAVYNAGPMAGAGPRLVTKEAAVGLVSVYLPARAFSTFWLSFGDLVTPYLAPGESGVAVAALTLGSMYVFAFMALRQIKVWLALLLVARRRWIAAVRLLLGDIVLNLYVLWLALLLAVFVVSRMNVYLEGRYFLPVLLPTMLLGVLYVPRLLPRRKRRTARLLFAVIWAAYSATMSPLALAAMEARFYQPSGFRVPPAFVRIITGHLTDTGEPITSVRDTIVGPTVSVELEGVAVALDSNNVTGVVARLDGRGTIPVRISNRRRYGNIAMLKYKLVTPAGLVLGRHVVEMAALPRGPGKETERFEFTRR